MVKRSLLPDGWYDAGNPVFSPDGKYLYLVSNRDFNPTFSRTDFEIAYLDMSKIYLIPLSKETADPFAPVNNEVAVKKDSAASAAADKKKTDEKAKQQRQTPVKDVKIDLENITERIIASQG